MPPSETTTASLFAAGATSLKTSVAERFSRKLFRVPTVSWLASCALR
jgi:hypothetical protein